LLEENKNVIETTREQTKNVNNEELLVKHINTNNNNNNNNNEYNPNPHIDLNTNKSAQGGFSVDGGHTRALAKDHHKAIHKEGEV